VSTEPLPSNVSLLGYITETQLMRGVNEVATEMESRVMIYASSFIKISSVIQKLIRGTHRHTDSMEIA
jgi:hypothetical protein